MKVFLNPGDAVVIETPNGERVVVTAHYNAPEHAFRDDEFGSHIADAYKDSVYLSVRMDAKKGRVPFAENRQFPNNHVVGYMRSIEKLEES